MAVPRYVLIANPGTKRCELYRCELLASGSAPAVEVVPWADVVSRDGGLDDLPAFDRPAIVRLESPGKDDRVTRLMLEAGARDDPGEPAWKWSDPLPKGLLVRPGLWFRGFRRVLRGLRRSFDARPHLAPTTCPLAVAEMFDKTTTCRKLSAAGVPVPETMATDRITPARIKATGWPTTYLKLNTGSSAAGIMVLQSVPGGLAPPYGLSAVTTLARVGGEFYNTRRLQHPQPADLLAGIAFLVGEGAIAQRGIPLARIDGENFDVRVVCVRGRPVASIFRLSPHPMTNLHLGGRRGDFAHCRAAVPTRAWLDALDHCSVAAGCFDSAVVGVDLAFEQGFRRHFVLELNAFGDFFPRWVDASGRSIHALEIASTAARPEAFA